jgi:hypothetical protein
MKGLAGLGTAALIAAAVVLWFTTRPQPAVVRMDVRELAPSADTPTFKGVADNPRPTPQKIR